VPLPTLNPPNFNPPNFNELRFLTHSYIKPVLIHGN